MQYNTIGIQPGIAKFSAAVVGLDGKVYFIPGSSKQFMILDPVTDMVEYTDFGLEFEPFSHYWSSAVIAPNGKIICAPSFSNKILVISTFANGDPATALYIENPALVAPNAFKWEDGYLHKNGLVYFPPRHFNQVLEFNPVNNSFRLHRTPPSLPMTALSKFSGSVKIGDLMYCMPFNRNNMLILNPDNIESLSSTTVTGNVTTVTNYTQISASNVAFTDHLKNTTHRNRWEGAVAKGNKIYGIPYLIPEVLVVQRNVSGTGVFTDHSVKTIFSPPSAGMKKTRSMFMGGALLGDFIYCSPYSSDRLMMINTLDDTISYHSLPVGYSQDRYKWSGAVVANGAVYFIPYNANDILKVIPSANV